MDKYDYKKFLLEELSDTRQEEFIFWKKNIPMPVELVYRIFDKRGELLGKYVDHIASCYLYAKALEINGEDWRAGIENQPTKSNSDNENQLREIYRNNILKSGTLKVVGQICQMFLLNDYEFTENSFVNALIHEGRKYKRLYIPGEIKRIISSLFPELLEIVARSNGDMFSNVVADELKIYRMGFADAFSGMFNKLIDFIIKNSAQAQIGFSSSSNVRVKQLNFGSEPTLIEEPTASYGLVTDGSIWEPLYVNAKSSYQLNKNHPFCDIVISKGKDAEFVLNEIASTMSEVEDQIVKDSERKIIETFRRETSRRIRLKIENESLSM